MGVAGSGKSTVGRLLSDRTDIPFYDADDFHPQANIDKMSQGIPLNDKDRRAWLLKLRDFIAETLAAEQQGILACSALKSDYRQLLESDRGCVSKSLDSAYPSGNRANKITWIYLRGDYERIKQRIRQRHDHFMKEDMLRSQFEALEEPEAAITIDISYSPEVIVEQIIARSDRQQKK